MRPREPEMAKYTIASNGQLAAGNIYACMCVRVCTYFSRVISF